MKTGFWQGSTQKGCGVSFKSTWTARFRGSLIFRSTTILHFEKKYAPWPVYALNELLKKDEMNYTTYSLTTYIISRHEKTLGLMDVRRRMFKNPSEQCRPWISKLCQIYKLNTCTLRNTNYFCKMNSRSWEHWTFALFLTKFWGFSGVFWSILHAKWNIAFLPI